MPKKSLAAQATPLVVQEHIQMWGKAIRAQRMVLRLTAAQLASRIGVSVPTVRAWKRATPAWGLAATLAHCFHWV